MALAGSLLVMEKFMKDSIARIRSMVLASFSGLTHLRGGDMRDGGLRASKMAME